MTLVDTVTMLEGMGFFDYVLPFMLIFVLLYAILRKTKVLSDEKQINATAALVMSLFVLYFAKMTPIGPFLSFFLGRGSIMIVVLVMAVAISVFFAKAIEPVSPFKDPKTLNLAVLAIVVFGTFSAISSSPMWSEVVFGTANVGIGGGTMTSIAVLAAIGAFIAWAVRG